MADELIDADTMARLSAMMRRAPMDQSSAAGMVPSRALPPNPYNTEFPDHIGRPRSARDVSSMPGVYNERFSDLVEQDPRAVGGEINWGSGASVPLPVEPDIRAPGHTRSVFSGPGTAPDPERAARVEQLMRELEEQRALEARLRALGR